jgi:hypothetical protein
MKKLLLLFIMSMGLTTLMAQTKKINTKAKSTTHAPVTTLGEVEKKKADYLLQQQKAKSTNSQENKKTTTAPAAEVTLPVETKSK